MKSKLIREALSQMPLCPRVTALSGLMAAGMGQAGPAASSLVPGPTSVLGVGVAGESGRQGVFRPACFSPVKGVARRLEP